MDRAGVIIGMGIVLLGVSLYFLFSGQQDRTFLSLGVIFAFAGVGNIATGMLLIRIKKSLRR
mgnify:CR=1 FL=1